MKQHRHRDGAHVRKEAHWVLAGDRRALQGRLCCEFSGAEFRFVAQSVFNEHMENTLASFFAIASNVFTDKIK